MKLIKVHWKDICGGKDWMDAKDALKWAEKQFQADYISIGYLLHKNKDFVVIAATYDEDGSYNDVSMIMTSVITKIESL